MLKKILLIFIAYLGCAVSIEVTNMKALGDTIKVSHNDRTYSNSLFASINTYSDGHSNYYTIPYGSSESWSRSDSRGFILGIKKSTPDWPVADELSTYYVSPGDQLSYSNSELHKGTQTLTRLKKVMDLTPNMPGKIKVNDYANDIKVGISTWNGGQSGYYSLSHTDTETWSRDTDPRGYLLYIKFSGNSKTYVYYIPNSNKDIGVYGENSLYIDGNQPLQELYAY